MVKLKPQQKLVKIKIPRNLQKMADKMMNHYSRESNIVP